MVAEDPVPPGLLAEVLEMSPMPIREALRLLDAVGLVENVPHRGARVTELSIADLREVYEARLALDQGRFQTVLAGSDGSRIAAGAAADHGNIVCHFRLKCNIRPYFTDTSMGLPVCLLDWLA